MILTLRTDKPEAEVGLFDESGEQIGYEIWQAHRELSETILSKIENLLTANNLQKEDLSGLVFYKGPGSFTGLRIGASVANAFAYSLTIPSVAETGENWVDEGINKLKNGESQMLIPEYGAPPHITQQKK
jgi:tRNA threonylcarbamoyladenosine biosynthesis protein TsaB